MKKEESKAQNASKSMEELKIEKRQLIQYIQSLNLGSIEEINDFLAKNVNGKRMSDVIPPEFKKQSNIDAANLLVEQANTVSPKQAKELILEALSLDSKNVKAYIFMGNKTKDALKATPFYRKAIAFAAEKLGKETIENCKGQLWGSNDAETYLMARSHLASSFQISENYHDAITEYCAILALDNDDHLGVRYFLETMYLITNQFDNYIKLHNKYNDEGCPRSLYSYAYYRFCTQGGDTLENKKALQNAHNLNTHIIEFLSGKKTIIPMDGNDYELGDQDEALMYVYDNLKVWLNNEKAFAWLVDFAATLHKMN